MDTLDSGSAHEPTALRVMRPLRSAMRRLRTSKSSVPVWEKFFRGALLAPLYLLFMIPLAVLVRRQQQIVVAGRTNFGAVLKCRLPDLIQTYLWVFNEWEPDLTRLIAGRLNDGDVFVDVGANIGYYSLLAGKCVGTSGRVVAIEASPPVFADLENHIVSNGLQKEIRPENKAAAAEPGTLSIYSGPVHNIGMTTTLEKHSPDSEGSVVEAQPLPAMLSDEEIGAIRLIKVDVEGAEPDVVAGMVAMIPRLPAEAEIILELSPKWWGDPNLTAVDVLRPFTDAGFHVYEMRNNYAAWRYLWPNDVSDAVRVRRELTKRVERLDLVLSRADADSLPIESRGFVARFAHLAD